MKLLIMQFLQLPVRHRVGIAYTVALSYRLDVLGSIPAAAFSLFSCFVVSVYAVVVLCFVSYILFIVPCILFVALVLYCDIL
jgi:hypothetical protein